MLRFDPTLMRKVVNNLVAVRDWRDAFTIHASISGEYSERETAEMLNRLVTLGVAEIKANANGMAMYRVNPLGSDIAHSYAERARFDERAERLSGVAAALFWITVALVGASFIGVVAEAVVRTVSL